MFRIGILGAADIAYNKFIPALNTVEGAVCGGVASNTPGRAERFAEKYGLRLYSSYEEVLGDDNVDCVYIPLPPAFHYEWAKKGLLAGKHVFLEKPSTTAAAQTAELVKLAAEKGLVLQENYMFQYHAQLQAIQKIIASGELGRIRLYRTSFGFPKRGENDFRYNKDLGGGTMLDNGGYTVKLLSLLLGDSMRLLSAHLDMEEEKDIDIFGSAQFVNAEGVVGQAAFGMDCQYQCSLEVWGSRGRLTTGRIYTAPAGAPVSAVIEDAHGSRQIGLPQDDHFARSIEMFIKAVSDEEVRSSMYNALLRQSELVERIRRSGAGEDVQGK